MDKEIFFELIKKWEDEAGIKHQQESYEEHFTLIQCANELRDVLNNDDDFIKKFYNDLFSDGMELYV